MQKIYHNKMGTILCVASFHNLHPPSLLLFLKMESFWNNWSLDKFPFTAGYDCTWIKDMTIHTPVKFIALFSRKKETNNFE